MLAAYDVLLHRYTSQETIVVGMGVCGSRPAGVERERRPFREHRRVCGPISAATLHFESVVSHVRQRVLEAVAHQDVPFERLVAEPGAGA